MRPHVWCLKFQAGVDWTSCDTDEHLLYYTFDSVYIPDVASEVVKTYKRNGIGKVVTGRALTSRQVSGVNPAERWVTLDEAKALMQIDWYEREEDVPPLNTAIEYILAVDADAEDYFYLQNIQPPGAIEVQSSLGVDFLDIQEKCRLYSLDWRFNPAGVYRNAIRGLNSVCNPHWALERLAETQASVKQLMLTQIKYGCYLIERSPYTS